MAVTYENDVSFSTVVDLVDSLTGALDDTPEYRRAKKLVGIDQGDPHAPFVLWAGDRDRLSQKVGSGRVVTQDTNSVQLHITTGSMPGHELVSIGVQAEGDEYRPFVRASAENGLGKTVFDLTGQAAVPFAERAIRRVKHIDRAPAKPVGKI